MKTVVIYGQNHHGSTYHAAHLLADRLGGETQEFFLPKDFGEFCTGCAGCFYRSEDACPHAGSRQPIVEAMDAADVIILASPVYVMRATGPMKTFLDHLGYRFMVHRPSPAMFTKQGVCVSTTAGAGTGSAMRDMATSLLWWGVARIYRAGFAVRATNWTQVSPSMQQRIDRKMSRLAARIRRRTGHVRPGLRTRFFFFLCRMLRRLQPEGIDYEYWQQHGWLSSAPWKSGRDQ